MRHLRRADRGSLHPKLQCAHRLRPKHLPTTGDFDVTHAHLRLTEIEHILLIVVEGIGIFGREKDNGIRGIAHQFQRNIQLDFEILKYPETGTQLKPKGPQLAVEIEGNANISYLDTNHIRRA